MIPSTAGRLNFILKIFQLSFSPISIPFSNTSRIFRNRRYETNFFARGGQPFFPSFSINSAQWFTTNVRRPWKRKSLEDRNSCRGGTHPTEQRKQQGEQLGRRLWVGHVQMAAAAACLAGGCTPFCPANNYLPGSRRSFICYCNATTLNS